MQDDKLPGMQKRGQTVCFFETIALIKDNDQHLTTNKGLECARDIMAAAGECVTATAPNFEARPSAKGMPEDSCQY